MKKIMITLIVTNIFFVLANAEPDFLVLGVSKCGTTALYRYMTSHPQILKTKTKEIHFFDHSFEKGIQWYEDQFPKKESQKLIGEATPGYFSKEECLPRILKHCPHTKFIVVFRNPVKRAISAYLHWKRLGKLEGRTFEQALSSKRYHFWILESGKYITALKRWLAHIPKEQLLIIISEDLYVNPEKETYRVFTFLGLKDHKLETYPEYNKADNKESISQKTLTMLKKYFEPYNKELEQLLGRMLPW